MQKLTVKDFIDYNGPCFSCGNDINFRVINNMNDGVGSTGPTTTLRPTIRSDHFSIDLDIKYNKTLQLWIFFKSNKIVTSHGKELERYLWDNKLSLKSYCDRCYCTIESDTLEFNLEESYIKPISLSTEYLKVTDDKRLYEVRTYHHNAVDNGTVISVTSLNKSAVAPRTDLTIPLLPLWKFKTRERFINKMKTYITFS